MLFHLPDLSLRLPVLRGRHRGKNQHRNNDRNRIPRTVLHWFPLHLPSIHQTHRWPAPDIERVYATARARVNDADSRIEGLE
jgi:hypothetical protein